jgi:hypothetical protein
MNTDTYKIEMQITSFEKDKLFIPIGRGVENVEVAKRRGFIEKGFQEVDLEMDNQDILVDEYKNIYLCLKVGSNERVILRRDVVSFPPPPDLDPKLCLKNDERFCKWKEGGYIEKLTSQHKDLAEDEKVLFFGEMIKSRIKYSYPRARYEYTDKVLEEKLSQDCLGLHGVLCAMLRSSGIPSVLDVGLRLNYQDQPHVWLWYFSSEKEGWQMVDINDSPTKPLIGDEIEYPRMSVSLGTTHNIEGFVVSFVQYMVSEKMLAGDLKQPHGIQTKIVKE